MVLLHFFLLYTYKLCSFFSIYTIANWYCYRKFEFYHFTYANWRKKGSDNNLKLSAIIARVPKCRRYSVHPRNSIQKTTPKLSIFRRTTPELSNYTPRGCICSNKCQPAPELSTSIPRIRSLTISIFLHYRTHFTLSPSAVCSTPSGASAL